MTNLKELDLHNNNMSGSIPPELGNLVWLQWLTLGLNQLSGGIPPELGNLTALEWLGLENNRLVSPDDRWINARDQISVSGFSSDKKLLLSRPKKVLLENQIPVAGKTIKKLFWSYLAVNNFGYPTCH